MLKLTKQFYRDINHKIIDRQLVEDLSIKEVKNGELSTFSYVHGGVDFSDQRIRLARGLTLDENDNVVTVGFEKFFVENQLDTYSEYLESFKQEFSKLSPKETYKAYEKLDGTLIVLGVYKDDLIASTTSSTTSDHAKLANEYFQNLPNKMVLIEYMKSKNVCLMFEYISKFNQIAVEYNTVGEFVLLGECNKDTFKVTLSDEIDLDFKKPEVKYFTYDELQAIKSESKGIEGFVVWNEYGRAIKIKTNWWFETSTKTTIFFNSNKITTKIVETIVEAILNDTVDELYAIQNSNEIWKQRDIVGQIHTIYKKLLDYGQFTASKFNSAREISESNCDEMWVVMSIFKNQPLKKHKVRDYILERVKK